MKLVRLSQAYEVPLNLGDLYKVLGSTERKKIGSKMGEARCFSWEKQRDSLGFHGVLVRIFVTQSLSCV